MKIKNKGFLILTSICTSILISPLVLIGFYYISSIFFFIEGNITTTKKLLEAKESITHLDKEKINELIIQIDSLNSTMRLEEIIGILAIFVTITALVVPLISLFSFSREKEKLNRTLENFSNQIEDAVEKNEKSIAQSENSIRDKLLSKVKNEFHNEKKSVDKIIQENAIKRNKIILSIHTTKSEYLNEKQSSIALHPNEKNVEKALDTLATAQVLELKLLKLLSEDDTEIIYSFAWMWQILDPADKLKNSEHITNLIKTLDLINDAKYFNTATKKAHYHRFKEYWA